MEDNQNDLEINEEDVHISENIADSDESVNETEISEEVNKTDTDNALTISELKAQKILNRSKLSDSLIYVGMGIMGLAAGFVMTIAAVKLIYYIKDNSIKTKTPEQVTETTTTSAQTTLTTSLTTAPTTTISTTTKTTTTTTAPPETEPADEFVPEPEFEDNVDLYNMPFTLRNYGDASVYFNKNMDVSSIVEPLAENNYKGDESHVDLSIESVYGIPKIKVKVLDKDSSDFYKTAKIKIHMDKLFKGQEADLEDIYTVKADIVTKAVGEFVGDDGSSDLVPGNFMGVLAIQTATDGNSWEDVCDFAEAEWNSEWGSFEIKMEPGDYSFTDTTEPQYIFITRYGIQNQADFYIADLRFEDRYGNVIACYNF